MDGTENQYRPILAQDPSSLTTAQLYREIAALAELTEAKMLALTERLTSSEAASKEALTSAADAIQRGLDKAEKSIKESIESLHLEQKAGLDEVEERITARINGRRQEIDQQFLAARELTNEKFKSVETQFIERDKRAEQTSQSDRSAIDAALTAQKEATEATNASNAAAIAKSEIGFTKQFDQIGQSIISSNKSVDEKIDDLKSRMDRGEGRSRGLGDGWGYLAAVLGILIAVVSLIVMVMRR